MINISQHSVILLGYPLQAGYYIGSGNLVNDSAYLTTQKFGTFGCNKFFRAVPVSAYGIVRGLDTSSEQVHSATVSLKYQKNIFDFNSVFDVATFMTRNDSVYYPYMKYPFLIFFKDDTSILNSLSLANTFNPDVIDNEEEMI